MKFMKKYEKYSSLVLRLVLGLAFIAHGWQKVSGLEGWIGMAAGWGVPAVLAYMVAFGELLGGAGILLGALTRWASVVIAVIMVGALFIAGLQMPYLGGWEVDLGSKPPEDGRKREV